MMSDTTAKYLRKLKTGISGDKRSLWGFWQEGDATKGTAATLHSYPVSINNDMPSVASNGAYTGGELAFGDYKRFVVRQAERAQPFVYAYLVRAKDGGG